MFRVFSLLDNKFIYFNLFNAPSGLVNLKEWPVQKFTGLYDRNKKPIYEGDIINCYEAKYKTYKAKENVYYCDTSKPVLQPDVFCYKGIVYWNQSFCGFYFEYLDKKQDWGGGGGSQQLIDTSFIYEVIGNNIENEFEYSNNV